MMTPNDKMLTGPDSPSGLSEVDLHQNDQGEEGIIVAIRMRPLNHIEGDKRRVWKVLPKYSSVTQTTSAGKPLPERVIGRTFFTFDKTFGEDANTARVYNDVAQSIVTSVVNGLNGTIFAYGQTSSGKTHTMQGSGTIQSGSNSNDEGGVVHMAAKDIFSQIEQQANDRIFLVRASFLEIYNEEVRDLLSPATQTLHIREDPKRGVFVQSVEEIVTDFESLLRILFEGEKSRAFAATAMNERSSRSHTIFRVTIESRQKGAKNGEDSDYGSDDENTDPNSDSAVRIATLNLVDLAGSESVRHTGATGERKKEGAMINQSLLTLSRVMVALGSSNQTHVNFRDSKLTRILQPSLSGNARMAVICCATPSELYLEETRSTLQFASRAKLVKTNAKINEVLDDRSIIRRLQRELAEARRSSTAPPVPMARLKALETKAATADTAAMEAQAKLDRLKSTILNGGQLFGAGKSQDPMQFIDKGANFLAMTGISSKKKRRRSDGFYNLGRTTPSKSTASEVAPNTAPRPTKKTSTGITGSLSPSVELGIVRAALSHRAEAVSTLKSTVAQHVHLLDSKDSEILTKLDENRELAQARDNALEKAQKFETTISSLRAELDYAIVRYEESLAGKDVEIREACSTIEKELHERDELRQTIVNMESDLRVVWEEAKTKEANNETENARLQSTIIALTAERDQATQLAESIRKEKEASDMETAQLRQEYEKLQEERVRSAFEVAQCHTKLEELQIMHETDQQCLHEMRGKVEFLTSSMHETEEEKDAMTEEVQKLESTLVAAKEESSTLIDTVSSLECQLSSKASEVEAFRRSLEEAEQRLISRNIHCQLQSCVVNKMESKLEKKDEAVARLLESHASEQSSYSKSIAGLKDEVSRLSQQNAQGECSLSAARAEVEETVANLNSSRQESQDLRASIATLHQRSAQLSGDLVALREDNARLSDEQVHSQHQLKSLEDTLSSVEDERSALQMKCSSFSAKISEIESEKASLQVLCAESEKQLDVKNLEKEAFENEKAQLIAGKEEALSLLEESNDEVESLKTSQSTLKDYIVQLEEQVSEMHVRLAESNNVENSLRKDHATLESAVTQLSKDKGELENRFLEAKGKLSEAAARIENLENETSTLEQSAHNIELETMTLRSQKTISTTVVRQLENEKTELERQLDEARGECQSLESKMEQANSRSAKIQLEKDELYRKLCLVEESAKAIALQHTAQTTELQTTNEETRQDLHRSKEEVKSLLSDIDIMRQDISQLEGVKVDTESRLKHVQEDVLTLRSDIEGQAATITQLENEKVAQQKRLTEAEEEAELLWSEKEMTTKALIDAQLNAETVQTQFKELFAEKSNLEDGLAVLQADNENVAAEKSDLECRLLETEEKLKTAISEAMESSEKSLLMEETKRVLEERIARIENELASSQQASENLCTQNQSLESAIHDLENVKAEMEQRSQELTSSWQLERQSLEEKLSALAHSKLSIVAQLEDAAEQIKALQAEKEAALADAEGFTAAIQDRLQKAESDAADLQTGRIELEAQLSTLENDKAKMHEEGSVAKKEIASLRNTVKAQEGQIEELVTTNGVMGAKLAEDAEMWRFEKQTLAGSVEELESSKNALSVQLEKAHGHVKQLHEENQAILADSEHFVEEVNSQLEHAEFELSTIRSDKEALENQVVELSNSNTEMSEQHAILTEEIKSMQATKETLEAQVEEVLIMKNNIESELRQERERSEANKHAMEEKIQEIETSKIELEGQLTHALTQIGGLESDKDSLLLNSEQATRQLLSRVEEAESSKENLKSDMEALGSQVAVLESDLANTKEERDLVKKEADEVREANQSLEEKLRDLEAKNFEVNGKLLEESENWRSNKKNLEDRLTDLECSKEAMKVQLEASAEKEMKLLILSKEELEQEVSALRFRLEEAESKLLALQSEQETLRNEASEFKAEAQEQRDLVAKELDTLIATKSTLELQLRDLEKEKNDTESKFCEESSIWQTVKNTLENKLADLENSNLSLHDQLKDAVDQTKTLRSEREALLSEAEESMSDLQTQLHGAKLDFETSRSEIQAMQTKLSCLEAANSQMQEQHALSTHEADCLRESKELLEAQLKNLEASKLQLQTQLREDSENWSSTQHDMDDMLGELEDKRSTLQGQLEQAQEQIKTLLSDKDSVLALSERSASDLQQQLADLQHELEVANERMKLLISDNESLLVDSEQKAADHCRELNETKSELESLRFDREVLRERVSNFEEANDKINEQHESTAREADALRQTLESLKSQIQELGASKTDAESKLREEIAKWESERQAFSDEIAQADHSKARLLDQLSKAEEQIQQLQSESLPSASAIKLETRLREADGEINRLDGENMELKRLLTTANESVEEARGAALLADDELKNRERELEDAVYRLSQLEEELREYDSANSDESHQDLLNELSRTKEEKQQVEYALEKEQEDRIGFEEKLKRQIGDEQRTLINEGEKRMNALRLDAENLKKALKQSEEEAYGARQEIEEQRDQVREANAKIKKFEEKISAWSTNLESQESKVANLMSNLNKAKADNLALKDSVQLQKERLRKTVADKDNALNELSVSRTKLSSLEKKVSDLSNENAKLAKDLQEIKLTANESTGAEIEKLQQTSEKYKLETDKQRKKIEQLQNDVISKDERITKLKAVSLTKSKMEALKKIKEERAKFKEQLGLATREIEALKNQATVSSTDSELAEVRFEKEALETKLRKYAAHCQRLEDDRAGIVDVINSCDRELLSGSDVHQAVTILCDKVSSLEEECDSISKGTRRSNIEGDIEKIRHENSNLKAALATSRSKLEKVGKSGTDFSKRLAEHEQQLASIVRERDDLKRQLDDAQGGANGAESKLRFLEQENLQLMLDLKGKQKQLQRYREELEHLKLKGSVDNPTLALGTIDLMSMNNEALQLVRSGENSLGKDGGGEISKKTTPLKDNQRTTRSLSRKKRSAAETDEKRTPIKVDKENVARTNHLSKASPAPASVSKRIRLAFPGSAKKPKPQQAVPGLGEANTANDDNTGECKQS